MTKNQKIMIGCGVVQAAGALMALIGIIGEAIIKHKQS